jgi:hypothetical protein
MTSPPTPATVTFRESDYPYGAGPLTMRLERIDRSRPIRLDGEDWYLVAGVEIGWNGADLDRREVLVCATRLPAPASIEPAPSFARRHPPPPTADL